MSPLSFERLLLRHNATFGEDDFSKPKVALESQANRNAVSYMPLPAVQSAAEVSARCLRALSLDKLGTLACQQGVRDCVPVERLNLTLSKPLSAGARRSPPG
jgi:hypothetical protein